MRRLAALLLPVCLVLAGCTEAEETWEFDGKGGGTYALSVRWNADLWRRVGEVLGPRVMERFVGRAFPLRKAQWEDGLRDLAGVQVLELEESTTEAGLRQISCRLEFAAAQDLLGWEVLARRTVRIESEKKSAAEQSKPVPGQKPAICKFYMEPIARVPVLDRVGALLNAVDRPPPPAEGAGAERDPGPLERLGLEETAAELVWRMVKLPLAKAKLQVTVRVSGEIVRERGQLSLQGGSSRTFAWDLAALRKAETDRTIDLAWQPGALDAAPAGRSRGDRPVESAATDPRKR